MNKDHFSQLRTNMVTKIIFFQKFSQIQSNQRD